MGSKEVMRNKILVFISKHIEKSGYFPSVREIAKGVELKSPSTVQYHIDILRKQGILKISEDNKNELELQNTNSIKVPILYQNSFFDKEREFLYFPKEKNQDYELFAFKIKNDSLIDIGIFKNDYIIAEKTSLITYETLLVIDLNGNIIIRQLKKGDNNFILSAYNKEFEEIKAKNLKILGKVIGIQRFFN